MRNIGLIFRKMEILRGYLCYSLCLHKKGEFDLNYDYARFIKAVVRLWFWFCCWRLGCLPTYVGFALDYRRRLTHVFSNADVKLAKRQPGPIWWRYIGTVYLICNLRQAQKWYFRFKWRMNERTAYRWYWFSFGCRISKGNPWRGNSKLMDKLYGERKEMTINGGSGWAMSIFIS